MCIVQVGTLVLQRSHKYFELEIFQFYLWSWMPCTSGLADMEHATSPTIIIGTWLPTIINAVKYKHVASLMFINIHGPSVCRWNPQTYVNSWTVRHRDAADTRTLGAVKTGEAAMEHPDPLWDIL